MITIRVLEAIDHVHPLVLVGLPGEDVERKAGHWAQTVRRGCSLDVEMNSATILSSRTELEKISTACQRGSTHSANLCCWSARRAIP
jgi:hypothetical protein